MARPVTIVGAGIGGLVTAVACREAGLDVQLFEAKKAPGGRARSLDGDYRANWGPHVLYASGSFWQWLDERGLGEPAARVARTAPIRFRTRGRACRVPPQALMRCMLRLRSADPPDDVSFAEWARDLVGERAAALAARLAGALVFDADPGRLSAAFVMGPLRQVTSFPPSPRYLIGGWSALVDRLAAHAIALGAAIETGSRVETLPDPPVVVATRLETAAELLGDPALAWPGGLVATLDVGISARRGDAYILFDLDEAGFAAAYSTPDPSLAPQGHRLVQAQLGIRPGESFSSAVARVEALVDVGFRDWRDRMHWRRQLRLADETGALDPPGSTWRDRPRVDRGGGAFVVSDKSAAPGLLGEVSFHAALGAVESLVTGERRRRAEAAS
jgi:phytoene dehydrogenase-like protein